MDAAFLLTNFCVSVIFVSLAIDNINCTHTYCPLNFPYSYKSGRYCCRYNKEKPGYNFRKTQDVGCDGSLVTQKSHCCLKDHFMRCPGIACETPSFQSAPCPSKFPYPYYYGLYCCKYSKEKPRFRTRQLVSSTCNGGDLTLHSFCCHGDTYVSCLNPPCTAASWWSLTWESEGNDNPQDPNYSRKLRVPRGYELTIGRGYDISNHVAGYIISADLNRIGVNCDIATNISNARGLKGSAARQFIADKNLTNFELTYKQQWGLFKHQLNYTVFIAKHIFATEKMVSTYGKTDFDKLNYFIKGLLIDLLFRGDYTESTIVFLQPVIIQNDIERLKELMSDRTRWPSVPFDRFNRRRAYMKKAVESL